MQTKISQLRVLGFNSWVLKHYKLWVKSIKARNVYLAQYVKGKAACTIGNAKR